MMKGSTWVSSAGRVGTALLLFVVLLGVGRALAQVCTDHVGTPFPTDPTEPPTGFISTAIPSVDFDSKAPPPAGAATGPADCGLAPFNCSRFELTVVGPTPGQLVRVRLDWLLASNDYDLYIFNPACEQVGSSGNGLTTFEEAVFTPVANATYEVVIVHFAAAGDQIDGRAFLAPAPVVEIPNRIGPLNTGIRFSRNGNIMTSAGEAPTGKGTVFAPAAFSDGEPSARADVRGNQYPAGIRGVPAGVDVWRFGPNAFCPQFTFHTVEEFPSGDPSDGYVWLKQPDGIFVDNLGSPDAGGGDIELAVSFPADATTTPALSMVSLTLANITSAASLNRGNTWTPPNPVAANVPPADRQWIEAYGTSTVYLYYRTLATLTGLVLQKSIDNGITYEASKTIVNPLGYTPGWIDVDQTPNPNGSVDIYLSAQNSTELVIFHCVDPNPNLPSAPITCTRRSVDNTMSHGHIFDVVTVGSDNPNTVYTAWSNNQDVFYAFSTNKGQTWSGPVRITGGPGWTGPKTNIFPWITAGASGRIGIVWYGTDALTSGDNNAEWKAYYAYSANAKSIVGANRPQVRWLPASDHIIHKSNVSQAGFSPNDTAVNRNLIDFFQVAHDPRNGAAVIAFTDDHNDLDGHTYWTRQIQGPDLIGGNTALVPCPPLTPFVDPEVLDFSGDGNGVSGVAGPNQVQQDILNLDYGSETDSGNLYLTADIAITALLALPPQTTYRAYFAVNTVKGLMDAGNQYYIELFTGAAPPATNQFRLGVADRRDDGSTATLFVENINTDQTGPAFTPGIPGEVHIRVNVNRLDYSYTADGAAVNGGSPAPGPGDLVIGLIGQTATAIVLDNTRGGSYIILGQDDGGNGGGPLPIEVECDNPLVREFGCWETKTTSGGEKYCREVWKGPQKGWLELTFPGTSTKVQYDYFVGPRGGFVEVIIDGQSRTVIDQYAPANTSSPHNPLTSQSITFTVAVQANPHTIRILHRTDLQSGDRIIAYVDGFRLQAAPIAPLAGNIGANQQIQTQNILAPGATATHKIVADLFTGTLGAVAEPVSAELAQNGVLVVELLNPAGGLVQRSPQLAPPLAVGTATIVPGQYTVRVRNVSSRAVSYQANMLRNQTGP